MTRHAFRQQLTSTGYSVREISEQAAGIEDIVRLDIGQPDFPSPDAAVEAAKDAIGGGDVPYTSLRGIPELREEIAEYESHKAGPSMDEIMVTTGGTGALFSAFETITEPGDPVLFNDPCWSAYSMMAAASGIEQRQAPFFDAEGELDTDSIRAAMDEDVRAIVINSPENPTGRVYRRAEIRAIADIAEEHDCWLIADEVYDRLTFGTEHVAVADVAPERTLTVNSTSKNMAMTGWRLGWLIGPPELLEHAGKANRGSTACPNFPAQHAALGALRSARSYPEEMAESYRERRDLAVELLRDGGLELVEPEGAIYLFPDVGQDSWELCRRLVREGGVAMVPGAPSGSGSRTNVRLCFGSAGRDDLREGIDRLLDEI